MIFRTTFLFTCLLSFSAFAQVNSNQNKTLTLYTYDSFASKWGPGPKIKKAFEANCEGCSLKIVALEDGVSILNRLRLEGKNTKADIVLGLDTNLMAEAQKTGLFAKHLVNTSKLSLPNNWENPYFLPFDYGYFSFIYNKETLTHPPKSLKELVETKEDISIIYQDPRTSTPGQGLMLWVKNIYGENAPKAWQQLAKKTVTVTKGWSEAYKMFLENEADMVLSYTTSPAYHFLIEKDEKYQSASFSEGHYLQIEIAAKLKRAQQNPLADKFMQFILSDVFQKTIPTTNWMYPVTQIPLPAEFEKLTKPSTHLTFTPQEVAANRPTWVREWQSALIN
jgi:thiamine transport system substrate-binding protein